MLWSKINNIYKKLINFNKNLIYNFLLLNLIIFRYTLAANSDRTYSVNLLLKNEKNSHIILHEENDFAIYIVNA